MRPSCPRVFDPVLRKLVEHGDRYFGDASVALEPVRHFSRPFSSVLQVRVGRGAGASHAFVKICKPRSDTPEQVASMRQNVLDDFDLTMRVHTGLLACDGLSAVRPIACFPEHLAIVTEQVPGPTLADLLRRHAAGRPRPRTVRALAGTLEQVGAWLRAFQAIAPLDDRVSLDAMRRYLSSRLSMLESSGSDRLSPDERVALERAFDRRAREVPADDLRSVWIHADLCPENIVALEGRVTVLDFMMAKPGAIYHDLSHLFLQLDLMRIKPWFSGRVIDQLQAAMLEAFEPGLSPSRPLFELLLIQHVLCHLVTLRAPASMPLARLYAGVVRRRHRRWLQRLEGGSP